MWDYRLYVQPLEKDKSAERERNSSFFQIFHFKLGRFINILPIKVAFPSTVDTAGPPESPWCERYKTFFSVISARS
jgi:hypothetical protein